MMRLPKSHRRRAGRWAALAALVLAFGAAHAVSVETWSPSSAEQLAEGTLAGTAIDRHGHLTLGPALETLWGPEPGVVWALAPAAGNGAYVALSGPGRVLRLSPSAEPEVLYEASDEVLVTALARGRKDEVWFGLSPQGEVLRSRGSTAEKAFDAEARFIWAMAADRSGDVWVGTGSPGKLLRLPRGGEVETVYESGDDPIRSLVPLDGGGVIAGTGEQGRVVKVAAGGRPFVLLDTDESEVVSLAVGPAGSILALTAGRKPGAGKDRAAVPRGGDTVTVRAKAPNGDDDGEEPAPKPAKPSTPRAPTSRGGALYRIDPDGGVLEIWSTDRETPYAVTAIDGRILVATGPEGTILELDPRGEGSGIVRFPSNQPSALALAADGRVLVGGTEDARVASLGPRTVESGTWTAKPIDAERVADWGAIRWDATVPEGAGLTVEVRAGNTDQPDGLWSEWSEVRADDPAAGTDTGVPPARWMQVRAAMTPAPGGEAPVLSRIEVSYLPRNRPPQIKELLVEPIGVAWAKGPTPSQARLGPRVADDPVARKAAESLLSRPPTARILKAYEAGARTFNWKAEDPDKDDLLYRLELRREGTDSWFPLADGVE
jgi:hypothetical protein